MAYTAAATTALVARANRLDPIERLAAGEHRNAPDGLFAARAASGGLQQVGQQRLVSVLGFEELLDREAV